MREYYIASVSWGKDSLYMLLRLMEEGVPLNEVAFYDTGMEFQAIYDIRNKVLPMLAERGIKYTEFHTKRPFLYDMLEKPVNGKNGLHLGYSWCGGCARWGTAGKQQVLDANAKKYADSGYTVFQYVGIAADEPKRIERLPPQKIAPLAIWGVAEAECLQGCYDRGFEWKESGFRLYDLLDRVSCWCCANKNLKELRNIYVHLPEYWERLKEIQRHTDRPMKGPGKSVLDLETRFAAEIAREEENKQLTLFT
ncbi:MULTISPECIES: phosphoadenosine phosphosulfate reductase [unclassified Neglectibacter]|uniref:phosphoadenosine phosphosulfate reductase n=1 Tax=unclassified Neglectibacter TaxID=2632164 RepID=UPI001EF07E3B|nr:MULTISPECIES: phosphoadenosine phosphosulfate reductase [unclassified Neglectibacter]